MWTVVCLIALTFTRSAAVRPDGLEFHTTDDDFADDPRTVAFPAYSALLRTDNGLTYPASRNVDFGSLLDDQKDNAVFNDESDAALPLNELALKAAEPASVPGELKTKEFILPIIQDSMQRGSVQIPALPQLFRGPTIFGFTAKNAGRKRFPQEVADQPFLLQKLTNGAFMAHQSGVVPDAEQFTSPDNSLSTFSLTILGNSPLMSRPSALFGNGLPPNPKHAWMRKQHTSMAARFLRNLAQSQLESLDSSSVLADDEAAPELDGSPFFQPEARRRFAFSKEIPKLPSAGVPTRLPELVAHGVPLSSGLSPEIIYTASSRRLPEMDNKNIPLEFSVVQRKTSRPTLTPTLSNPNLNIVQALMKLATASHRFNPPVARRLIAQQLANDVMDPFTLPMIIPSRSQPALPELPFGSSLSPYANLHPATIMQAGDQPELDSAAFPLIRDLYSSKVSGEKMPGGLLYPLFQSSSINTGIPVKADDDQTPLSDDNLASGRLDKEMVAKDGALLRVPAGSSKDRIASMTFLSDLLSNPRLRRRHRQKPNFPPTATPLIMFPELLSTMLPTSINGTDDNGTQSSTKPELSLESALMPNDTAATLLPVESLLPVTPPGRWPSDDDNEVPKGGIGFRTLNMLRPNNGPTYLRYFKSITSDTGTKPCVAGEQCNDAPTRNTLPLVLTGNNGTNSV